MSVAIARCLFYNTATFGEILSMNYEFMATDRTVSYHEHVEYYPIIILK